MKSKWTRNVSIELNGEEVESLLLAYERLYQLLHKHIPSGELYDKEPNMLPALNMLFRELDFNDEYEFIDGE